MNEEPQVSRRALLGSSITAATAGLMASGAAAEPATEAVPEEAAQPGSMLDEHYESRSGRDFSSQVIHHGEADGYQVTPISQDKATPGYQRPGNLKNPTVAALLRKMMEMEGTEAAVGGASGMGIISQTYMALLKPGDRLVTHRCNYHWVMVFFRDYLPSWGVEVEFLDFNDPENLAKSLKDKPATFVHWEPYVNPNMDLLDTPTLLSIAKAAGATVVLDNTWLSPYLFQPARLGADLVIHSVTKYVGGHGNAMGGVVSGSKTLIDKIEKGQNWFGGLLRPMDAFLITQGVKTLPLRMQQHSRSAQQVAEYLASHPAVSQVRYGGLDSWNRYLDSHAVKGFGGMLGVEWKKDKVHERIHKNTRLILNVTSLGDPVSRITHRTENMNQGIPKRFSRVSIGLEEPEDIIADFEQAIDRC